MARPIKETGKPVPGFTSGFRDRLEAVINRVGGGQAAADLTGGSIDQLTSWRLGRSRPDFFALLRLCEAAGETVDWLAKGVLHPDVKPDNVLSVMRTEREHMGQQLMQGTVPVEGSEDAIALPRLTIDGSAGHGLIPTREEIEDYLSVSRRYLREVGINPHYAHVLRLSGHSMAPTLLDKDLVIVDTSQNRVRDEEIYALAYGDAVLIKRIRPQLDGGLKIVSDNKGGHYEDAVVPAAERGQVRIVGRVGGFLRYV
ncbi:hypothetical protein F1D61_13085 [Methylobacterium aquaticum]|nr:hypothetical protein F1D61_13085 [Methylobacterium aquaticum]